MMSTHHCTFFLKDKMASSTHAAVLLCSVLASAVASLPPHHPQHHAPAALIRRITRSNPLSLTGSAPVVGDRGGVGPARPAVAVSLLLSLCVG